MLLLSSCNFAADDSNKAVDFEEIARSYGPSIASGTTGLATAQFTHPIVPAQVNNTSSYPIKTSGYYFLTEDLAFSPRKFTDNSTNVGTPNRYVISITVDNVILDLNSKVIVQQNGKDSSYLDLADVTTIFIQDGLKNIIIKNGTINYATGHGIRIGKNCRNISISDVRIVTCGRRGIIAEGEASERIQNLKIENCHISDCSGSITPNATLYGDSSNGNAIGIDFNYVENTQISGVICNNNVINRTASSNSDTSSIAAGMRLQNCTRIMIENSLFDSNAGPFAHGVYARASQNLLFTDCKADENKMQLPNGAASSTVANSVGFKLEGCNYCSFENCQANHNHTLTKHGVGFYLDGTQTSGNSNYNLFKNCIAIQNEGGQTTAAVSIGAGFLSEGKDNNNYNIANSFIKCQAQGNNCLANTAETDPLLYNKAAGICLLYEDGTIIQECKCISNGDFKSTDTVTQSSLNGDVEVPHVLGYGIYLGPAGDFVDDLDAEYGTVYYTYSKNIVISECWLMFNSRVGLKDDAKDCQSLIMRNYAFRNGTQGGGLSQGNLSLYSDNYQVQYLQSNELLTLTTATVGGFGALSVANPYANVEWQVSETTAYTNWPIGQSTTIVDSMD